MSATTSQNGTRGHLGAERRIRHGHDLGPEFVGLGDERLDRRADTQCRHLVGRGTFQCVGGADDIEGLGTDRAGRTGDGDADGRTHALWSLSAVWPGYTAPG
jgi:hypothetical protein